MRVSPKKLLVNLKYTQLKGNVLDVSLDETGIIYNLVKIKDSGKIIIEDSVEGKYNSAALFFSLGTLNKTASRELLLNIFELIEDNGEVYIWDRVKEKNELIHDKVIARLDDETTKEFSIMNLNPFYEFNLSRIENLIKDLFILEEKLIWDNVIYLKLSKKK